MTESYDRDTRVIRPGTGATPPPPPPAPSATATGPVGASPPAEGGLVAELRPYFPRMALGGALVLMAEIWWAGRHRRKARKRERKRRLRNRR